MEQKRPGWIVRWSHVSADMLLWADYPPRQGVAVQGFASFRLLFPANERYPEKIHLAHFETQEGADALAFDLTTRNAKMVGHLTVEECWIKRCKRCYDCLCGERVRRG